jgi:ABC-type Na+ efflux pump permease subunit
MRIFGPLLAFDLVRLSRSGRSFRLRCLYALALLGLLYVVYSRFFGHQNGRADLHELARFAENFCALFLVVQYVLVLLLTPALTCEAILEERQRRTFDCLLTTQLSDHEIIFGKLAARMADVTLLLVAGLPILSLTLLFGGVDPTVIWCGFALNLATMWLVDLIGMACSLGSSRQTMPLFETYLLVAIFCCAGGGCGLMGLDQGELGPFAVGIALTMGFAVLFTLAAVNGVRTPAERSVSGPPRPKPASSPIPAVPAGKSVRPTPVLPLFPPRQPAGASPRPRLEGDPILWRERYGGPPPLNGCILILVAMFLFMGLMGFAHSVPTDFVATESFITTALTTIALLMIARHAAGSIAAEKEQRTLESLLATPLSLREILGGKWWGTIYRAQPYFLQVVLLWVVAVGMSTFSILALPWLVAEFIVYVVLAASLGLVVGLLRETKRDAQFAAVALGAFILGGGHWWCTVALIGWLTGTGTGHVVDIGLGLTPVAVLYGTPLAADRRWQQLADREYWSLTAISIGLLLFAIVAELLWHYALARFRRTCGRTDDLRRAVTPT